MIRQIKALAARNLFGPDGALPNDLPADAILRSKFLSMQNMTTINRKMAQCAHTLCGLDSIY